jgi:flagellin
MTVINTNVAASITANALTKNERAMGQAMERLSTGQRINSASDDAAGLAISSRMTAQVNGLNMAVRNVNDGISMIQTADGALVEVTNMLQRMRELTVQAASLATMGSSDLTALNTEFQALDDQIDAIGSNTEWNGTKLLDGSLGSKNIHVGANASQVVAIQFADLNTDHAGIEAGESAGAGLGTRYLLNITEAQLRTALNGGSTFTVTTGSGAVTVADTGGEFSGTNGASATLAELRTELASLLTGQGFTLTVNGTTGLILTQDTPGTGVVSATSATGATITQTPVSSADLDIFTNLSTANASTDSVTTDGVLEGIDLDGLVITGSAQSTTLGYLDTALDRVNAHRATLGATINRLEYAADNLSNVSQNTSASRSRILDADYASETTELARTQIIQQAATAMLSQANQQAQSVLALLR